MVKLNDTKISKLKWDESKRTASGKVPQFQWVGDAEVGGLHLRIYPPKANGRSGKVFWLKYGSSVDRHIYRIGAWGEWTLADARDEARKIRKGFYDRGIDPNRAKQKRIQDANGRLTVEELVEAYFQEKAPVWADSYTSNNRGHADVLSRRSGGYSSAVL
jgi:hypothetical protein